MSSNPIIFSVDVEDWQQSTWDRNLPISKKSADNTLFLLDVLNEYKIKTTMFILGKFAKEFPNVVKEIHKNGHEIGCHGHGHEEIFHLNKNLFKSDVSKSKDCIEQIIGHSVLGYRAPDFSIVENTTWALEVLIELGFEYDSSIFPIYHGRYGIPYWPSFINSIIINNDKSIIEFPLSTGKIGKYNLPIAGGGYFRLFPRKVFFYFLEKTLKKQPFIFYMHPYELDFKEFDKLDFKVPFKTRIHQGLGRKGFLNKLRFMFDKYDFTTFEKYLEKYRKRIPDYNIEI